MKKIITLFKNNPFVWSVGFLVATIIPIVSFFNIPIPIPAWSVDITRLEIQQFGTYIQLLEDQLERARLRFYENLRNQDQIRREGKIVPDFYLREKALIDNKINEIESELTAARERKIELSKTRVKSF